MLLSRPLPAGCAMMICLSAPRVLNVRPTVLHRIFFQLPVATEHRRCWALNCFHSQTHVVVDSACLSCRCDLSSRRRDLRLLHATAAVKSAAGTLPRLPARSVRWLLFRPTRRAVNDGAATL